MNFTEAIAALIEGKAVTNPRLFKPGFIVLHRDEPNFKLYEICSGGELDRSIFRFSAKDVLSEDWGQVHSMDVNAYFAADKLAKAEKYERLRKTTKG